MESGFSWGWSFLNLWMEFCHFSAFSGIFVPKKTRNMIKYGKWVSLNLGDGRRLYWGTI